MVSCVACSCSKTKRSEKMKITFHQFPRKLEQQLKWIRFVDKVNFILRPFMYICSQHFEENCFIRKVNQVRLKSGAVPTIKKVKYSRTKNNYNEKISAMKTANVSIEKILKSPEILIKEERGLNSFLPITRSNNKIKVVPKEKILGKTNLIINQQSNSSSPNISSSNEIKVVPMEKILEKPNILIKQESNLDSSLPNTTSNEIKLVPIEKIIGKTNTSINQESNLNTSPITTSSNGIKLVPIEKILGKTNILINQQSNLNSSLPNTSSSNEIKIVPIEKILGKTTLLINQQSNSSSSPLTSTTLSVPTASDHNTNPIETALKKRVNELEMERTKHILKIRKLQQQLSDSKKRVCNLVLELKEVKDLLNEEDEFS